MSAGCTLNVLPIPILKEGAEAVAVAAEAVEAAEASMTKTEVGEVVVGEEAAALMEALVVEVSLVFSSFLCGRPRDQLKWNYSEHQFREFFNV